MSKQVKPVIRLKRIITQKTERLVANCDKSRQLVRYVESYNRVRHTSTFRITKEVMGHIEALCTIEIEVEDKRIAWSYVI